jgi:5-methylcytosine-specific restriction endonuclease McrA
MVHMKFDFSGEWRSHYEKHIRSARWRNTKAAIIKLREGRCEHCQRRTTDIELHHKTYERLGRERIADLELLCRTCHADADRVREAATRQKVAIARYQAGLETYASKKYGEEWADRLDSDQIAEEFDSWLENQD